MLGGLMHRGGMSPSSRTTACFEHIIFAGENGHTDQRGFRGDPAYRKFSGDCACNPEQDKPGQKIIDICAD
jgi:hypothetical protein